MRRGSGTGTLGKALDLSGGANSNAVDLPDNLLQGEEDFSTSFWVRPDAKGVLGTPGRVTQAS